MPLGNSKLSIRVTVDLIDPDGFIFGFGFQHGTLRLCSVKALVDDPPLCVNLGALQIIFQTQCFINRRCFRQRNDQNFGFFGFQAGKQTNHRFRNFTFGALDLLTVTLRGFQQKQRMPSGSRVDHNDLVVRFFNDFCKSTENRDLLCAGRAKVSIASYNIDFTDVSFGYGEIEVLHNLSFQIPQNTTTAIVGPSGSGKSTICNLITRFYDVNSGSVKIGGHDVREFTCDSLLKNISMVFQNVYLFNDTIRNNIKFGKSDATEDEIIEAAKKACCHDFIMALPEGYDTMIGEGGSSLSGGEKQRISIARAMLKDAPIVILDEATASIDPENEHLIQEAISALTHGKTIITIAHRLATIENADQILVIDGGTVAQRGTHKELLQQEGTYKKFIQIREQVEGWRIQ